MGELRSRSLSARRSGPASPQTANAVEEAARHLHEKLVETGRLAARVATVRREQLASITDDSLRRGAGGR